MSKMADTLFDPP